MTDNEIIKALKCCASETTELTCGDCPLCDTRKPDCHFVNAQNALDLINRQKAEIDKLKIEICALSEKRITFPERLKIVKHARNHAIKEFAERLKATYPPREDKRCTLDVIDNLIKEMTEN